MGGDPARDWFLASPLDSLVPGARDGFPLWLARDLLEQFRVRDLPVLDPFLGSGTTMVAADALNIPSYGIERDPGRAAAAKRRVRNPQNIFTMGAEHLPLSEIGSLGGIFTSPPFQGFGPDSRNGDMSTEAICNILSRFSTALASDAYVIVELIDVPSPHGGSSLAEASFHLERNFLFERSLVLCDTGPSPIDSRVFHTTLQVWRPRRDGGRGDPHRPWPE
ncbi:MAG: DNA methyltransferase [Allosphingosinicella sp.]